MFAHENITQRVLKNFCFSFYKRSLVMIRSIIIHRTIPEYSGVNIVLVSSSLEGGGIKRMFTTQSIF